MKKLINLLTTLSIASSTTFITSDLMTNSSLKNFNKNENKFYCNYNEFDKTIQFTIYIDNENVIKIIDIIEHYKEIHKEQSSSGAIVSILLTYSIEGNIKPQEEHYYEIGHSIVQHYEDLQNNNKREGIYCSFNKSDSIFRYLGTYSQ